MRIGIGWDVHRLAKGKKLVLGGIIIPFSKGLAGHSDADVLVHAVIDALFGASGQPDIGTHFPPSDKKYKGISSMKLLAETVKILKKNKFEIVNIDSTVIAEAPKMGPYINRIKDSLSKVMSIPAGRISVKAKTEEGLGYIGKGKAIAAQAVCLLRERA